jgi:hypothetical protein
MLEVFERDWVASANGRKDEEDAAVQEPSRDAEPPPRAVAATIAREVGAPT